MIDLRIHGVGEYELLSNVSVDVNGYSITVLKGFRYDGASIPQTLWDDVGCPLDYAFESCIHDALYRTHLLSRKDSDKIFHALISRVDDVDLLTAKAMYLGVRLGGSIAYDNAQDSVHIYREVVSVVPIGLKW